MKDKTLKQLVESIKASGQPKTSAYDTSATVTRVENGVAWVHIPGGVRETPVKLTINAQAGDTVQVRVSGGRAFMVGNATAPPTDDRVANSAVKSIRQTNKAVKVLSADVDKVRKVAKKGLDTAAAAEQIAEEGKAIAEATNQYFWHDNDGAHVTTTPQETDHTGTTGMNSIWNSLGLLLRNGSNILTQLGQSAVAFYDGIGNNVENIIASFGSNGSWIGRIGGGRLELNDVGLVGIDGNNDEAFRLQFANASGTAEITERGETIPNTNTDMSLFPRFTVTPVSTPIDETQLAYAVTALVVYADEDRTTRTLSLEREFDSATSRIEARPVHFIWTRDGVSYDLECSFGWNVAEKSININASITPNSASILSMQVNTTLIVNASTTPSYTFGTRTEDRTRYGAYSFTTGRRNSATGFDAVALGLDNVASGQQSFAANDDNTASGMHSFAEGSGNTASGGRSHAAGGETTASSLDQFVIGRRNIDDPNDQYAFIIGNGDYAEQTNSNAYTVDWDGNADAAGKVNAGAVTSFTPTWETGQEPTNSHCVISAGLCSIFYQGPVATHTTNTLIGTLPVGTRPLTTVFCPFVKAGVAYGTIRIEPTGGIYVGFISSTTASNRIYFNCSYPVV